MHPDRIAELLQPFLAPIAVDGAEGGARAVLLPGQLQHISIYIDLLLRWNARVNLTSVRQPEQIVTRHFGESLFTARHLFPASDQSWAKMGRPWAQSAISTSEAGISGPKISEPEIPEAHVIDIGSGAGFPGIPIRIWNPHLRLTLIESNHKKATFLREVSRTLTLTNVNVFPGRVSDFHQNPNSETKSSQTTGPRDVVTLRAVERFETILPEAIRLIGPSARLAILIGQSQLKQLEIAAPGVAWRDPVKLPLSSSRLLAIGTKESRE
jgi:16S rRNA (guanine527-N7)-methyltransferase